jgi:metal-responsive CopG/Arc/MetJ family transcriptional regulator
MPRPKGIKRIRVDITLSQELLKDVDELLGTEQGRIPRSQFIEIILRSEVSRLRTEQEHTREYIRLTAKDKK